MQAKTKQIDHKKIVFLHGNSLNSSIFSKVNQLLSNQASVSTIDLPGNGICSSYKKYNIKKLTQHVKDCINTLKPDVIVAHSLSGHLVLQGLDGITKPEHLILIGTPPLLSVEASLDAFSDLGMLMNKDNWTMEEKMKIAQSLSIDCYGEILNLLNATDKKFKKDWSKIENLTPFKNEIEVLNKYSANCYLYFCLDDLFINYEYCNMLHTQINNLNVQINQNSLRTHIPFFNNPYSFVEEISKFI